MIYFRVSVQTFMSDIPLRSISFLTDKLQLRYPPDIKVQRFNIATHRVQFKFFFNLYFLVALSQFVPAFKAGGLPPSFNSLVVSDPLFVRIHIAPLAFVLCVTMGKEAYDDYKRHLRDREANSQRYLVLEHPTSHSTAEDTHLNTQYTFGTLVVFTCWRSHTS